LNRQAVAGEEFVSPLQHQVAVAGVDVDAFAAATEGGLAQLTLPAQRRQRTVLQPQTRTRHHCNHTDLSKIRLFEKSYLENRGKV